MGATYDLEGFHRSVRAMQQVPGKHGPDVLNKAVAKITIGAKGTAGIVQRTKKAAAEKIKADLQKPGPTGAPLIDYLATIALKRKGIKPVGISHHNDRVLAQGANEWRMLVKEMGRRILAARLRSAGYIVAGWLHALDDLRGKAPGAVSKSSDAGARKFAQGSASKSFATAARLSSLTAGMNNTSEGADLVSTDAIIQASIDAATADTMEYLRLKFGKAISDCISEGVI